MKLKSIRKLFLLVRTKIDLDLHYEKVQRCKHFDEMKVLKRIRDDCKQNVGRYIQSDEHVFLISNYDQDRWDFERLDNAICNQLPMDQRQLMVSSLPKAGGKRLLLYFLSLIQCI